MSGFGDAKCALRVSVAGETGVGGFHEVFGVCLVGVIGYGV